MTLIIAHIASIDVVQKVNKDLSVVDNPIGDIGTWFESQDDIFSDMP